MNNKHLLCARHYEEFLLSRNYSSSRERAMNTFNCHKNGKYFWRKKFPARPSGLQTFSPSSN